MSHRLPTLRVLRRVSLAFGLLWLMFFTLARSALAWSPAIQLTNGTVNSLHPSVVVDSAGQVHAAWFAANGANGSGEIFYTKQVDGTWSPPVSLSHHKDARGAALVELALTPANELMAIWIESDYLHASTLYYRYKTLTTPSSAWSAPVALTDNRLVGFPAMAAYGDALYAVWPTTTDDDDYADTIMMSVWRNGAWSTAQPLPLATGTFDTARIAFDSQGRLHLTWNGNFSNAPADLNQYQIRYSVYDGTSWSTLVNVSQNNTYAFWPALAIDGQDNVHLIWLNTLIALEEGAPIFETVYYQRLTAAGWLPTPVQLSTQPGAVFTTAQSDAQGHIHFTWSENTASDPATFHFRVRYTMWDGASLLSPIQVSDTFPQNGHVSMDLSPAANGDLWLLWAGGDGRGVAQIFASRRLAQQISQTPLGSVADFAKVAGRNAEELHALWVAGVSDSYLLYSQYTAQGWSNPQRITPVGINARYATLAVDGQNRAQVAFYAAQDNGPYIYYTGASATGWLTPTIVSPELPEYPSASTPHLAVDGQDRLHIVWQGLPDSSTTQFAIYYRTGDGQQWSAIQRLSTPGQATNAPRVAVDSAGHVHVVWYGVNEQEIYYTQNDGVGWTEPLNISQTPLPVPKQTIISQGPDLAIDATGAIHVGWLESSNGSYFDAVYYATNRTGHWAVEPVMVEPTPVRDMQRQSPTVVDVLAAGADQVHLLWHDVDRKNQPTIYHSRKSGGTWSSPTILLTAYQTAQHPSGYLDEHEQLHLLWSDLQTVRQIFYSRFDRFNWIKVVDAAGVPLAGSQIYRNGTLLGMTDGRGLHLPATLAAADRLAVLAPVNEFTGSREEHATLDEPEHQWAYRVYLTNWNAATVETPTVDRVHDPTQAQLLRVKPAAPLILFNLVVSIEWQATPAYLATIQAAMQHASAYLYDITDGQMAFGQVTIYDGGRAWANADLQISAKNNARPYAYIGGLRAADRSYVLRVGRHWDGNTSAVGDWDAPNGYRTLIHEFGHYGLSLYDEYFGYAFDTNGNLTGEVNTYCIGPENRLLTSPDRYASVMDYQYNTSELSAKDVAGLWATGCTETLHWHLLHESTWETLAKRYADQAASPRWQIVTPLARGSMLNGPVQLPDFLPAWPLVITRPLTAPLPSQIYTVTVSNGAAVQPRMRVVLYSKLGERVTAIDQGITNAEGQLAVYGGAPGDSLQATSLTGGLTGSVNLGAQKMVALRVRPLGGLQRQTNAEIPAPYVQLTAEAGANAGQAELQITLHHVSADARIRALVTTPGVALTNEASLSYSPVISGYSGSFPLPTTEYGTGSVQILGIDATSLLELYNDYELQSISNGAAHDIYAPDGNLMVHLTPESLPGDTALLLIQPLLAPPGPLTTTVTLLGTPYHLSASGAVAALQKPMLLKLRVPKAPALRAEQLILWWWNPALEHWQMVPANFDPEQSALLAVTPNLGSYAVSAITEVRSPASLYLPLIAR